MQPIGISSLRDLLFKNLLFRPAVFMVPGNQVSKFTRVRATSPEFAFLRDFANGF